MNNSVENIDPSGDLLILLEPPNEPFAPWGEAKHITMKSEQFRARVSSAVLRHASRVLCKEFDPSGPWKQPLVQSDGLRHKHFEDFDPDALKHVLNIIHFRNSLVPNFLPEEDLAKIAVIVDYLECHEATTFVAQTWTQGYEEPSAKCFTRPTALWLFVSVVFKNDRIFQSTAAMAVTHGVAPFNPLGLAFPARIVSKWLYMRLERVGRSADCMFAALLDKRREDRIGLLLKSLHSMEQKLITAKSCTQECNAWHLGALLICMTRAKLHPRPVAPFDGISIDGISLMLTGLREMTMNSILSECHKRLQWDKRKCDKARQIQDMMDVCSKGFALELQEPDIHKRLG